METTKFSSQLSIALEQAKLHLRQALNPLTERAKSAVFKTRELLAGSLDAAFVANAKIAQFGSQLLVAFKQTPGHLRQSLNPLTERAKNVIEKPRRLQEARRARENDLRQLL